MLLEKKITAEKPKYFLQQLKANGRSILRNQLLLATIVIIIGLAIFYRDIVFGGRTFLMENTTYGTMPPSPTTPFGPYGYPGSNPTGGATVLDPGAIAWEGEPISRVASKILAGGEIPLWNPYTALGEPFLADGVSAPLDPIQVLFYWVPQSLWPLAMDLQVLLRFFIGAFFTYLFVRLIGLSFGAALFAALSFPLSTYFVAFGNHPQMRPEMLIPVILYANERLVRFRNRFAVSIYALVFTWVILSGMIEPGFLALALGGLWYLYRAIWQIISAKFNLRLVLQLIFYPLVANVIGIALSAPAILPLLENINQSAHVHDPSGGSGTKAMSLVSAIMALLPNFVPGFGQYFHFFTVVVILALLGAMTWFRLGSVGQAGGFFGVFALIFCLKEYGFSLFTWIGDLPVYNQILLLKYITPSVGISLAVLAALGIEFLLSNTSRLRLPLLGAASLLVIFITLFLLGNAQPILTNGNLVKMVDQLKIMAGIALAIGLVTLFAIGFLQHPQLLAAPLILLVVLEPTLAYSDLVRPVRYDPYTVPPFVDFLHSQSKPFRVGSQDAVLYPSVAQAYSLESMFYMEPLVSKRRLLYYGRFIAPNRLGYLNSLDNINLVNDDVDRLSRVTGTEPLFYYTSKYLDLLNVQYIVANKNNLIDESKNLLSSPTNSILFTNVGGVKVDQFSIQGDNRQGILMPPGSKVSIPLMLPSGHPKLFFAIGSDPTTWTKTGDGASYMLTVTGKNGQKEVFNQYIDPKHNPSDQKWLVESIDLTSWSGQQVDLTFSTNGGPAGDTTNDQPYWANPSIYLPDETSAWSKPAQQTTNEVYLMDELLTQNASKESATFKEAYLRIGQDKRTSLFMHADNKAELTLTLPTNSAKLDFGIGLDPQVWTGKIVGDGVEFGVGIKMQGSNSVIPIFDKYIDPKHNTSEQKWIDQEVDLSQWKGQTVTLVFSTLSGPNKDNSADWAYWSEIKLAGQNVGSNVQPPHFSTVYDKELTVYRNNYVYPRAFVVYQAERVGDMFTAVNSLARSDFDPSRQVVLEGSLDPNQAKTLASPNTKATTPPTAAQVVAHTANTVTVKASLEKSGVLVLSESYAPGWVAYVDGTARPVLPADLALRGVYLETGSHEIKFVYEPTSFKLGLVLFFLGLLSLIAMLLSPVLLKRQPAPFRRFGFKHSKATSADLLEESTPNLATNEQDTKQKAAEKQEL